MRTTRDDLAKEREAFRATVEHVGPDAPTACGLWTAADLAVHVATGEVFGGLPNAPFRLLVGRGVRLDRMAPVNARALDRYRRRHGFDWAMERLARPLPRVQSLGGVAPVSLLEVWAHHEDVLAANDVGRCHTGVDLDPVLGVLVRYQRRLLRQHGVRVVSAARTWHDPTPARIEVRGEVIDLARWLSGRGGLDVLEVSDESDAAAVTALEGERLAI